MVSGSPGYPPTHSIVEACLLLLILLPPPPKCWDRMRTPAGLAPPNPRLLGAPLQSRAVPACPEQWVLCENLKDSRSLTSPSFPASLWVILIFISSTTFLLNFNFLFLPGWFKFQEALCYSVPLNTSILWVLACLDFLS